MPSQSMMPSSQSIWNALLTVLGVALLGCLGWQMAEISKLKEMAAAESSVEFTTTDANELRDKLTTIMQQIDLRISLIERDIEWVKTMPGLRKASGGSPPPTPIPQEESTNNDDGPAPNPSPEPPQFRNDDMRQQIAPRYDLRK